MNTGEGWGRVDRPGTKIPIDNPVYPYFLRFDQILKACDLFHTMKYHHFNKKMTFSFADLFVSIEH